MSELIEVREIKKEYNIKTTTKKGKEETLVAVFIYGNNSGEWLLSGNDSSWYNHAELKEILKLSAELNEVK